MRGDRSLGVSASVFALPVGGAVGSGVDTELEICTAGGGLEFDMKLLVGTPEAEISKSFLK